MTDLIAWFIWRRWLFASWMNDHKPCNEFTTTLHALHNNNVAGCRTHPVIYRDMCRIVRGIK